MNKKTSKLAVLGELGAYPLFLKAVEATLKYEWHLKCTADTNSLVCNVIEEMKTMATNKVDCWLTHTVKMRELLKVDFLPPFLKPDIVRSKIKKKLKEIFGNFWLSEINKIDFKGCVCGHDHSKLRLYKQFKGTFSAEPYLDNVRNRNQRCWISRMRTSRHFLGVEKGRWHNIPYHERVCKYCESTSVDNELHFLTKCSLSESNRTSYFMILSSINRHFNSLSDDLKTNFILCPTDAVTAKLANKYISLLFQTRDKVDKGQPIDNVEIISYTRLTVPEIL